VSIAKKLITKLVTALLIFVFGSALCAQTGAVAPSPTTDANSRLARLAQQSADAKSSADNAWMLTSAALVLMMAGPSLALFYGGLVRKKSVLGSLAAWRRGLLLGGVGLMLSGPS